MTRKEKDITYCVPENKTPTFTHELKRLKSRVNDKEMACIIDEIKEHRDHYLSFAKEEIMTSISVFSVLNPNNESNLGMLIDVEAVNKTFQYIVKIPLGAVEHLQNADGIIICSKEKELLGIIELDEEIKKQLLTDAIMITHWRK